MTTLQRVKDVCDRLAPLGWRDLLLRLTGNQLDIRQATPEALKTALLANLRSIDRTFPGFADFATDGNQGITPGFPGRSLLYHALASPNVYPSPAGSRTDDDFPTLLEIDTIENYIYSVAQKKLTGLGDVVVAVFAYQYRPGSTSVHGKHADMAYSRTGIARVGTTMMHYDALRRSFWAGPAGGVPGVAVMPARYGAFLAQRRKLTAQDAVVHPLNGPITGDSGRFFLVPIHKLFSGGDCLVGENLQLSFQEYHRSEKLRRIHQLAPAKGGVAPLAGFNINQPPFVRESHDLITLRPVGASTLLVSNPRHALAEPVTQMNSISGKQEFVRFRVPPKSARNRFFTSFLIQATNAGRAAPEYAHIRFHVRPNGELFDVNSLDTAHYSAVLSTGQFQDVPGVENGPLEAAHMLDNSCEGTISAQVSLSKQVKTFAAASFVAAPDFLPLVGQIDVQRWAESKGLTGAAVFFTQGAPEPLCYGRDVVPNPTLVDPATHTGPAFDRADQANATITALISQAPGGQATVAPGKANVATTWLTDAAADVFAPGWDTSMFRDTEGDFYANYGLGSPFPEDAKLCAALNSFWPAAAPDTGRTFGMLTAVPLLDPELGFHPNHPKVLAGVAVSHPGWDGEFGPFLTSNGTKVNFASIDRSDYTSAALDGRISLGLLGLIETEEQLARMDAFRECADRIRDTKKLMDAFRSLLVSAEKISDWSQRADRFDPSLTGPGYLYVFVDKVNGQEDPTDRKRIQSDVKNTFTFQVSGQMVGLRKNNGEPKVTPWLHP
ncbi:MAG: hypothetical protein JWQ49_22 [Edaphobacter sp.]|nr:hypothetical protein [Edaphobacter sp.]